tara:strand:+ start:501 stop:827 length:327 start_codon:yes stop_codon:yes gene_type:complete
MALNYTAVAGNNGVSGPTKVEIDAASLSGNSKVILPQATVSGTLAGNDFTANKTTALRWSVSQTQGTAGAPTSEVYSETCNLRYAYGNTSTIETDSGRYANGTATPRT